MRYEEQFQYLDTSDDGQDDEPEPEEDVDLLVDDVEREDAETVKLLHRPGRTKLVECALGHLEHVNFYINAHFKFSLSVRIGPLSSMSKKKEQN